MAERKTAKKAEEEKEISFEEALKRLSELVDMLEDGNAPLDKSLEMFEEGVKLAKICRKQLDTAEQKVKILTEKQDGSIDAKDFTATES